MRLWRDKRRFLVGSFLLFLVLAPLATLVVGQLTRATGGQVGSGACLTTVSDTSTVSVSSSAGKCIYTFTNGSNSLTPPAGAKRIDFLVVGGGGGGGSNRAGGGGSGGFYEGSWTYTSGSVDVTVGAGGAGGAIPVSNVGARGSNGGSSSITATGAQFAAGGGGGGGAHSVAGGNQMGVDGGAIQSGYTGPSGSGGGASMNFAGSGFTGGGGYTGSNGFSNSGAASRNDAEPVRNTGGGGGAGGAGVAGSGGDCSATSGSVPNGGVGLSSSISGTAVMYAGGGGGADARSEDEICGGSALEAKSSAGAGSGGSGIGGSGALYSGSPTNAIQNRGSGGGGGNTGTTAGGNGSAGIVILSIDATKPESSGSTTTEYLGKSTNTVSVAYSATDTNGVSSVTAYYSTLANLSSPTSCGSATGLSGTSVTGAITCTLPSNPSVTSTFFMYTVATDASGLIEDAPSIADDSFTHDAITPLSTSTTSRSASNSTTVSIGYSATDAVGLSSVSVYYTSNSNVQSGTLCGSANVSGTTATGSINCVTGSLNNGWSYYYYTVATDLAGQVEATADFTPASVVKYDITVPIFGTRPFLGAIAGPGVGVTVSSSEVGTAYLLKMSSSVSTEADILALDGTLWNSVAVTAASTDVTIPAGGLVEGSYVVYLVDEAGNISAPSEVVTIDNTAPNKPTVSLDYFSDSGSSQSDGLTNVAGPIFNSQSNENKGRMVFTAVNGASTVNCTANFVFYITNGSNSCGFSTLAAGVWTVTAVHIDGGGNTSPVSDAVTLTIDTTVPTAPTTTDLLAISDWGTSSTDNRTASTTPNFAVTALPESTGTVEIKAVIGGTTYTCSYTSASTDQFCALSLSSPNATTTVQARFTDAAGNVSAWNIGLSVTFDTTVPTLSFPSALATGYGSTDTWLGVNSEAGSIYIVADQLTSFLDIATFTSTQIKSATSNAGANTVLTTTGLNSDPNSYIYAMDTAGNLSTASSSIVIDTLAPTVVRVYGTDGSYKQGSVVNITVEFSEAVNVVTTGGTPYLTTGIGNASYVSGSGTANLVFRATVGSSMNIADLNYNTTLSLAVSGGTIRDIYRNNATLNLPALNAAESLGNQSNIRIDTTAPSPVYTLPTSPTNASTFMFTVTYSEVVTGLSASSFTLGGTAGSSCTSKSLLTDDSIVYYLYVYNCGEGTVSVSQTANTASDAAGNLGPASAVISSAVTVDRTAPTITTCACGRVSGAAGSAGTSTSLTSNSIGTGYLVKSSIAVYSLSDITSASDDQWNSVAIPIANSATTMNPLGLVEGLYYYYAVDVAGNLTAAYTTSSVTVDNTAPTLTYTTPAVLGPRTLKPSAILTETGKVYAVLSTLTPPSPVTTTWLAANGKFQITISTPNTSTAYAATIVTCCTFTAGTYNVYAQDDAGNITAPVMGAFTLDINNPTVTGAYTSASNGTYLLGSVIPLFVTFSETVNVSGTPTVILETGSTDRSASYVSGSGTNTLRFNYTVQAGDTSGDLDFVTSSSVSAGVTDDAGNPDSSNSILLTKIGPSVSGSISNASDIVVDGSVPTVTGVSSANGNQTSYFTTLTFNLDVSDFDAADVTNTGTATGCTVSVSATSAKVYVASFANCSDGTIIPRVRVDAATLANGITGPKSAYSSGTITKDTTAPVVTPGGVTTFGPVRSTTFTVNGAATVYLVSTSVQVTDVSSITNTASNQRVTFTYTSGTTTVTGSGLLDGDYKYYAVDSYGNLSAASTGTFTYDSVAPTITLTPASLIIGGSASMNSNEVAFLYLVRQTVTVTNSTSITGAASLNAKGVYATNKSASLAVSGLASDKFYGYAIDSANNVSAQSVDFVTIDNTAPAITSVTASADGTYIIGQTVLIDIVFDDTVTVNTTNGTPTLLLETGTTDRNASYVSGSGTTTLRFSYTVQEGDLNTDLNYVSTSSLAANGGTLSDVSGNAATLTLPNVGFPASLQSRSAVVVRGQRITASAIYSPATNPTNATSVTYSFSFSSAPTGLVSSDFTFGGTATGCTATVSGAVTSSASVVVSGCSDGTVILKLPAGSMSDSFGNTAPGSDYSAPSITFDRTGPVPTFTAPSTPTSSATLSYTVTFNETMSGLIASDFQVTGTATGCVVGTPSASSGTSVTVSLTSCSAGTVILTLKTGMVNDSLNNTGPATAVSATTVTRDVTVPSVSSFTPDSTPTNASSSTFTLTFSEAITGLTSADFSNTGTANGCLFSPDASSGTVFTVTVNSCAQGTVIPRIPAWAVADLASNSGPTLAFTGGTLTIDRTAPSAPNAPAMATASDTGLNSSDAKTKNSSVTATVSTPEATGSVAVSAVLGGTTVTCSGAVASSSGSCELVGLTEGSWTLSATFTDAAGNVSASSTTSTFVIDNTAPTVTITSPSSPIMSFPATYTLTFSEAINGLTSSDFANTSGTATGCTFTPAASSGTTINVSVSGCGDGTLALQLNALGVNDVVANAGPSSNEVTTALTIDNGPPTVTLVSATLKNTQNATVNSTKTGTAYLVRSTVSVTNVASITGAADNVWNSVAITDSNTDTSLALTGLADGTYYAYAVDSMDRFSVVSTSSIVIDTTAPTTPTSVSVASLSDTGTSNSDGITNDNTPTIRVVSAENGGTVTVTASLTGQSNVTCTMTGATVGATCDLATLANGVWTLSAVQVDVAGNTSSAVAGSLTIDTVRPGVVNVTSNSSDGSYKAGSLVTVKLVFAKVVYVTTTGGTPTIQLETGTTDRDASYASGTTSNSLVFNYTVQAGDTSTDLEYTSTAALSLNSGSITDVAGNTAVLTLPTPAAANSLSSNQNIVIDTTAPNAPTAVALSAASDSGSSSSDGITNDTTPTISVNASENGGTVTVTASQSGQSNKTCTLTGSTTGGTCDLSALVDGTWSVAVSQADAAGNISGSTSISLVIDSTNPTPTLSAQTVMSSANATVRSNEIGTAYVVKSTVTVSTIANITGAADALWNSSSIAAADTDTTMSMAGLGEGAYKLYVVDRAGNLSTGTLATVTIDNTAPVAPTSVQVATASDLGSSNSDGITSDSTPTIKVIAAENGGTITVTASKSGSSNVSCSVSGSTTGSTCDLTALIDGTWTLSASQSDAAGNASSSVSGSVTIDTAAPTVSGVTSTTADGSKKAGVAVDVRVSFDSLVNLNISGGSPTVVLETGTTDRSATYVSGSASSTLVFSYTVQAGDTSADLDYVATSSLSLNGSTISDVAGNNAVVTLAAPGATGSLGAAQAIVIDTTAPGIPTASVASGSDSGSSTSDGITSDTTPTINVIAAEAGGTVTVTASKSGQSDVVCSMTGSTGGSTCDLGTLVEGTWTVSVKQSDAATNVGTATSLTVVIDTTAPSPTMSTQSLKSSASVTVRSNEIGTAYLVKSTVLVSALVDITGSADADWNQSAVATAATDTTLAATGLGEGDYSLYVVDRSGNLSAGSLTTATIDNTAPVILSLTSPTSPNKSTTLSYTLTFDGAVSGLTADDFSNSGTATSCAFASSASAGTTFTITVTSCSEGTLVVDVRANAVADTAGNNSPASTYSASTITIDRTVVAPTLTSASLQSSDNATVSGAETGTVYLVKSSVTVSALADITSADGTLWNSVSVTAASSPTSVSLSGLVEGTYRAFLLDDAGNLSTNSSSSVTVDNTAPVIVSLTAPSSPTNSNSLSYTLTFDGAVSGLTAADFSNAGTATGCVFSPATSSGTTFTITVTSCSEGTIVVEIRSGAVVDAAGNSAPSAANSASSVTVDRSAPNAPTLANAVLLSSGNATVQGDELAVVYLVNSSIVVTNLASITSSSGTLWNQLTLVAINTDTALAATGLIDGTYRAYSVDAAGNVSNASSNSVTIDSAPPTLTISASPSSVVAGGTSTITFTLSETVSGFTASDITTGLGILSNFSGSGTTYTATFTASTVTGGTANISVAAGSFTDVGNNVNAVATGSVTVTSPAGSNNRQSVYVGSSNYIIEQFTTAGTFSWRAPANVTSVESLVVGAGGGGGGGGYVSGGNGGGGGAGAGGSVKLATSAVVPGNLYGVTVGEGGAGGLGGKPSMTYQTQGTGGLGGSGSQGIFTTADGGYGGCASALNASNLDCGYLLITHGYGGFGAASPNLNRVGGNRASISGGGGGGGAGSATSGGSTSTSAGGAAGAGTPTNFYGVTDNFGVGGIGGAGAAGTISGAGGTSRGNGGGGGSGGLNGSHGGNGGRGSDGLVVIRYAAPSISVLDLHETDDSGTSNTDNLTNVTTPTFTGTAPVGATVQLYVDGVASGATCTADSVTGVFACDTGAMTDGAHLITAKSSVVLAGGLVESTSAAFTVTLDLVAPTAVLTSATVNWGETATTQSNELGTVYLVKDTVVVANITGITAANTNVWNSVAITAVNTNTTMSSSGLISGDYRLYAADNAGNLSSASVGIVTYVDDLTAPTITLTSARLRSTQSAVVESSEIGTAYLVKSTVAVSSLSSIVNAPANSRASVSITAANTSTNIPVSGLLEGTYSAYAVDRAGNFSVVSLNSVEVDLSAPSVSSLTSGASAYTARTFDFTLTMSESIAGLTSVDFSSTGSATSCTFTPSSSSGTTFTVSVTCSSDGTVIPRLAANSVADLAGLTGPTSTYFGSSINLGATPTQLVLSTSSVGTASGAAFTTQPAITMKNAQNLVVTGVTETVTATITQVNGTGVLVGASTASFDVATGIATFTDLGISGTAGTRYTITFTSGSLTAATQNITVTVGAATSLAMSTQPVGGASGAQLATQPVVKVVDSGGNTVTSATASVGVTSTSGTLGGTRPRVTSSGVATFTDLTFSGLASQSHTLTFAATGLASVTSSSFNITAGAATQLVLVTQSVGTESGVIFTTQPVLEVRDSGGNKVTTGLSATANVTATVSSGAVLDGTRAVNAVAGVATYSNLGISGTAGTSYTISYSATGLTSAVQLVTPTVGPATKLVIDTQPVGAGAGATLATQPVINVTDSGGNVIAGANDSIVVSTTGSPISALLSGTTTLSATAGTATFTDLVFAGTAGTNYQLTFAAYGLTPATSANFTVTVGAATRLAITTQPVGGSAGALLATQPVVKILDAGSNVVTTSTATITVAANAGILGGTDAKNAVAGVATYSDLTFAGTVATDYTLTFSATGLGTVTSNNLRVTVGAPTKLALTTAAAGARYSQAFDTQPVVEVQDAGGNRTSSSAVITATVSAGTVLNSSGTTKTATASNGVAAFSALGIVNQPTTLTITYSSGSLVSTSQTISLNRADQLINFNTLTNRDFNVSPFVLSATSTAGLTISYTTADSLVCTVAGDQLTMTGIGLCSVTAAQNGDTNYNAAQSVTQTFTISRATPRVTFNTLSNKIYGQLAFNVSATADVPVLLDFAGTTGVCGVGSPSRSSNTSTVQVQILGAGDCTITVSRAEDATYSAAVVALGSSLTRTFTVNKAAGTITYDVATLTQTYDGSNHAVSATPNHGTATITYTGIAPTIYAPSTTPPVNAGSYAVVAVMNDANYEVTVPETLVVAKASGAIALDNNSLTQMYSGTSRSAVVSSTTPTGLASIITYTGIQGTVYGPSLFAPTNSGTYNVIATLNDINYQAQTSGTLTVAPGTQSMISFITRSSTTFDVPFNLLAVGGTGSGAMTYAVDGTVNPPSPCTVDANSGLLTPTGTGDCVVIATRGSSGNFAATSSLPFTVSITPAAQTVWFTSQVPSTPLPEATYEPTATASSGLAADISITVGDQTVCTFDSSTGVLTFVASGTCTITASQFGDGNWAAATSVTQSMTVGRLNQTITFAPVATKSYGDPIFALGATSSSGRPVAYAVVSGSSTCSVAPGGVVTLGVIGSCTISANQPGDSVYLPADEVSRTFTVIPTVPSAPFLSSVSTNDGSVTVAYNAPSTDGGVPIQAYTVTVRRAGEDRSQDVVRTDCTSSMSCYIDGLTNGDSYVVTVAASNIVGVGAASAESPLILPVLNPQAVRDLTARAGDTVIDVAWAAPANLGGGVFERYEIAIRSRDGVYSTPISITDPNALSYQFTGLDNGTGYDVKVVTITSGNSGSGQVEFIGNTAEVYAMPRTVPSPPREVTIAAPTGRVARVSWRVPLSDGGAVITSYSTNVPNSVCSMSSPVDVVCEISGLTPGSPLAIEVRAVNSVGESLPMSAAINLPNRPLPPSMRSVVVDAASATVEWSAPTSDGGQPIIGYFVYAIETGVRSISAANQLTVANASVSSLLPLCSTAVTSCQVEGLDPAKKYKFLVTAVNTVGESDGSEPWDPFGPDVTPTTPVDSSPPTTTSNTSNTGTLPRTGRGGRDSLGVVAWWIFIAGLGAAATLGRRRSYR